MVDIRDQTNKELAMRLVTDIQSRDVFYTDLNGFQVSFPPRLDKVLHWYYDILILYCDHLKRQQQMKKQGKWYIKKFSDINICIVRDFGISWYGMSVVFPALP